MQHHTNTGALFHTRTPVETVCIVLQYRTSFSPFRANLSEHRFQEVDGIVSQVAKARNKGKGDTRIRSTFEHNCSAMSFCQITLKLWELRQGAFNLSLGTTSLSKEERVFQHASCIWTKICLWSSGCPKDNVRPTNGATNSSTQGRWC